MCRCSDPPCFMAIVEDPPRPVDISRFITYQTDEYTTPTEAELVEELPEKEGFTPVSEYVEPKEKKPFRGTGYLRAEAAPEDDTSPATGTEEDEWAEFGIGIDSSPLLQSSGEKPAPGSRQRSGESKPDRSRSDRSKPDRSRRTNKSPSNQTSGKDEAASIGQAVGDSGNQGGSSTSADSESSTEHRKGRRRRRSRKGSTRSGEAGDIKAPATTARTENISGETPSAKPVVQASAAADNSAKPGDSTGPQSGQASGEKRKRRRRGRKRKPGASGEDGSATPE